ncbi:MAG: RES family NAD+ phosphorylase [Bacteroidales bacterium]|nr:RES family NAD+ phosphorylase [Bacteroidales bacterium]
MLIIICTKVLEKDCRELFRARIYPQINNNISHEGVTEYEKVFEPKEMGAPPPEKTKGGRLNPPGIPYLYLSSSKKTALAEMRPWVGAYICIAQFATVRKLKILDLTLDLDEKDIHDSDLKCFLPWTIGLQNAFSEPVCCEDVNSYTPTQYFAEYFKSLGFDGIKYESAMNHHGKNLAIFNPEDAIIKGKVNKIAIEIIDFSYIDADSDIPRTFTSYVKK